MPSPSDDPLFGNPASDLLNAALADTQPVSDPHAWQPPHPAVLQAMLPGYVVEEFIARGGMGAVYRGFHISLGRRVAIKILPPQLRGADFSFAERFKQEARAMAQLNHPGIVAVYDFGEMQDGTLYFIMEFIDGTDVARMVATQGRLSSAHAMAITAHVCDALQYAHERGVVHRDIKPANIMVGYDGSVKVADFGLAKSVYQQNTSLTMSGHVMGTPHFLAPEALTLGSAVDHRADIYAVGVMLYQMLTGRLPQGLFEMPSMQVPGLDPRYDAIIAGAMREDRELRYQRILDMRRALDAIVTQPVMRTEVAAQNAAPPASAPQTAPPSRAPGQPFRPAQQRIVSPPKKKKSSASGWFATALIVLVLAGGYALMSPQSPPQSASADTSNGQTSPPAAKDATAKEPLSTVEPTKAGIEALKTATKDKPFVNSLGMKFVPVPGTKVLMCIHPTRVKDFQSFAKEHPTDNTDWQHPKYNDLEYPATPDHAVTMVSWFDAKAFCDWLSKKEGVSYQLPSNDDWHAAASGTLRSPPLTDELKGYMTRPKPPVMNSKPNTLGIHDLGLMGGEWCADAHPKWQENKIQNELMVERARGNSATELVVTLPPNDSADGPDKRRPYAIFRCVVDLESRPSSSTALSPPNSAAQTDPYAKSSVPSAPPTREDFSALALVTIYGATREEADGYLGQTRLKSDPGYFAKRLTDSAIAGFASVVCNLAVSSRFGEDSAVKSQYSIVFSVMGKAHAPTLNLDLSSLYAPSGSRLKALDRPVKRGETIYLGSFDEAAADPARPVRIAFLTFR